MMDGPSLGELTPERRLRRLELSITRRLDGLLHGQHLGLLPGVGSEPAGSREYRAGEDEVRRMDWAVTARTTVPHVRTVDADRELATWVLVDATPSMDFGTAELEKRELAVAAVAAVGFLTAGAGNRLGAHVLGPYGVRRFPARTGRNHLLGMLRTLITLPRGAEGGDRTPFADAVEGVHRAVRRRGLVVVVGDFLDGLDRDGLGDAPPQWEAPLRRLGARHQVLAVQVTDPRERELPDVGLLTLVDPESGNLLEVQTGKKQLREKYSAAASVQRSEIAAALRRAGAAHLQLRTDRDWLVDMVRFVAARRRGASGGALR